MTKTALTPIDGSRSKLTGDTVVEIDAPTKKSTKPMKKPVASEESDELAAAFETPIGSVIDRGEKTVKENLLSLIERIERIRSNSLEWGNLSHVQRTMLLGGLYAAKEATGEKENGVPISFARFLGIAFK